MRISFSLTKYLFPILEATKQKECKMAKAKNQFMLVVKSNQVGKRQ